MHLTDPVKKIVITALISTAALSAAARVDNNISDIERGFTEIPDSTKLAVYWYWLNDNLSEQGVVKDLESMKKAGINRAFIGFQGIEDVPCGNVKFMSDDWWKVVRQALKTAGDLNIEIGIFNSPGWSQSGGPWVKPEQSMRYLKSAELTVKDKGRQTIVLPEIDGGQDVAVIAYKAPSKKAWSQSWSFVKEDGKALSASFTPDKNKTARTLSVKVADIFNTRATLKARRGGKWETVTQFDIDRYNDKLYVGFDPYAPIIISLPEIKADEYSLEIGENGKGPLEVTLSEAPMIERYAEKSLAKMFQEPLPLWGQYMWNSRPESSVDTWNIDPSKVVVLTDKVKDGRLTWNFPSGNWIVSRVAMVTTGVTNSPAMPDATGLEIDKMNETHLASHFDAFIGEILRRIPASERRTFKVVVEDSYETGGQNWTDRLASKFESTYGYSPLPYLPVLRGVTVGNNEISERFLWDLRRLVADMIAYEYVGGLKRLSNKHGLTTWLENYGHWGFPSEFLLYGSQSDEIAGEFWSEGSLGDIENRAASSCGHIYGKQLVWAESCTSGGPVFSRYPAIMKQRVDRFFTEGINATLLHLYIHQDDQPERAPGLAAWFGNEFNRKNTWFDHMDIFSDYLKRCNHMLQQGRYVADVAYFIGEDAPKMTGVCDPELPAGYSFDYINADVLKNRSKIVDGRLVLDSGMEYRLLVLPRQTTMRPELLSVISDMTKAGLTILGPSPVNSPSLAGYPDCDSKVKEIADEMWGDGSQKMRRFGKGLVCHNCAIADVMSKIGVVPDFIGASDLTDTLTFIHRTNDGAEIYFVANPAENSKCVTSKFRVNGDVYPELWNPVTGECRHLPEYSREGEYIKVPLEFAPLESSFIVFRNGMKPAVDGKNFPEMKQLAVVETPWTVSFDPSRRGPESPVTFSSLQDWIHHSDPKIRNYSGAAVYSNSFSIDNPEQQCYLDLGKVMVTAKVKINGNYAGGVWTTPYRLNITPYLKNGENTIEVEVINNWKNRLIGDLSLPESERSTWTNQQIWKPEDALQSSGLTGQVRILAADYKIK